MTLLLTALGGLGLGVPLLLRILGVAIPTRLIVYIAIAGAAVLGVGLFTGWIDGLHRQIATAQGQRNAALAFALNRQAQVFADVRSIADLRGSLDRQNASLAAAGTVSRQMADAQAQAAGQTARDLQTRDRTIAALRARRLTPDDCDQARELLRGN